MSRPLALLVNPAAAGGRALAAVAPARAELERLGAEVRVIETSSGDHARQLAHELGAGGATVVAVGGDGMVGTLAGGLRDTDGALAVIPAGRGNDFARVLAIPNDAAAAARVAFEGEERMLDVGEVEGKSFVGIASFGFDSDANRIANETRLIKGNLVYFMAGLRALASWRPARFEVAVDGRAHAAVPGYGVAVANSKAYGGGIYLVPHAELDDGMLDVMVCGRQSKLRYLAAMPKAFKGAHVTNPALSFFRGERIEVDADRPFTIYADGDPLAELPATITVARRALRVVVPRS